MKSETDAPRTDINGGSADTSQGTRGLTHDDYRHLEACFIDRSIADRMRLSRVDSQEGGRLMGRNMGGAYSGILIPNILPGTCDVREYRLRLDTPLEIWDSAGNKQHYAKYLSPIGDRGRLYFPPGIEPDWLTDTAVPILIVEGEKKSAACQRAANLVKSNKELIVTGIAGVDSWRGTIQKPTSGNGQQKITGPLPDLDLMVWDGRVVFILFDADLVTNKNVQLARRRLKAELTGRGSDVICVDMPIDPECKGIDDLLGKIARVSDPLTAAKRLTDLLDRAHDDYRESSEIIPLPEPLLPVPKLHADMIPEPLRLWLTDIADRKQCPLEFAVVAALTGIGAIIGNEVCVKPKELDSWLEAPNLWGAIVGDPGVMKSPAVSEATQFLREIEKIEDEQFRDQNPDQAFKAASREAEMKAVKQQLEKHHRPTTRSPEGTGAVVDKAVNFEELKTRFKELDAMTEPKPKRLTTSDATVEKLGELINENPRGMLNIRDELAGFFANLEKPGREGDRAFYLEGWSGLGGFKVDRIGRGSIHMPKLTLSIFGTIQPTMIAPYLGAVGSRKNDDGLIQRFQLLVYPDVPANYAYIDRRPAGVDIARTVFLALHHLRAEDIGASRMDGQPNGHTFLSFGSDAQLFFKNWLTELELQLRTVSSVSTSLRSHISKYRGLMPTLALIFQLIDWASGVDLAAEISLKNAELAAKWCSFLRKHAERLYAMGNHSGFKAAHELLDHIKAGDLGDKFSLRLVQRKCWRHLTDNAAVKSGIDVLVAHGHIEELFIPTDGRQKVVYIVNPRLR